MLHVSAKDKGTGKEAKITITASTKLSDTEKDRMMREAEQFEEQDKKAREEAETRNSADSMIYTAEKTLKELDDKFTTEQKDNVKNSIEGLRKALAEKGLEEIKAKMEVLSKIIQEAGASVYQQATQQHQQAAPEQESESEENSKVVDAEYRVVDEEKK
jgi:molecular chaperone DnaK